ncbi:AbrB/MazE/SpoVT family DNA-binding domain-containing protein [Candidatus Woesearchaeota archaeon]|nr:AbrB/MazE/SpoVT family DNA-binding domain-containing protein [Candidatus Woesearchaeota archaeon]
MLQLKRRMGPKGQIVLPKDVREQLNLRTGTELVFYTKDNRIIIEPAENPLDAVEQFCTLPEGILKAKPTAKEIKKIIDEQYEDRYSSWSKKTQ